MSLSDRGAAMAAGGLSEYIRVHFERVGQPGYTGLCLAENAQVADLVRERLGRPLDVPAEVLGYADMGGRSGLPEAVAGLLGRTVVGRPVDPAHVRVLSGAGAVLEALAFALGDPGDVVLVPTPSYAGFWPDLEVRPGLRLHPVPTDAADGFRLTPELLDRARATAPGPVRALLLTSPDNPRGEVLAPADLEAVLAWAEGQDLHVIADELYALSVHGDRPFTSVGRLRPSLGERLHLVWAVSKDLGASGLRVGVVVSEHQPLLDAVELQGTWSGVGAHTQLVLADLLADDAWVDAYLPAMRAGLRASADLVRSALDAAGIPRTAGDAGFFLLADLRARLDAPTWESEERLWRRLLDGAGVNLTPGSAMRAPEPGWFRVCHAAVRGDELEDALGRLVGELGRG